MKRKVCIAILSIICITFLLIGTSTAFSQVRGVELYNKLRTDRNLVKFEGISRVKWAPDGESYIVYEDNTFKRVDVQTGKKTLLFDDEKIISAYNEITGESKDRLPFISFSFLNGETKIKFEKEVKNEVFIYDLESGEIKKYKTMEPVVGVRGRRYKEEFSPDLKYTAYAKDYDLYIRDLERDKEIALTENGHKDLRNGFPDWVYPEELGQYDAFWWSPNSKKIAYMQFDESPVNKYPIIHDANVENTYVEMQSYPRAGENNPIVRFFIIDIETKEKVLIDTGIETNVYLYSGKWTNDGKEFTLKRLNRLQNKVELLAANPNTGKTRVILEETEPCYISESNDLIFLNDNTRFLWTSEVTGNNQIYLYDLSGKLIKQLTDKSFPVGRIVEVDETNEWVYFTGYETRGTESHLYKVKFDGSKFTKLTKKEGSHRVSVSPGGKYFTDFFSSFENPGECNMYDSEGKKVRKLGEVIVSDDLKELDLKRPEHFTFKSADGKETLDGMMYFPADFDKSKKYPVIMSVYGGPGSKQVYNSSHLSNRYYGGASIDSRLRLAQLGFIVVSVDHRGAGRRGKTFETLMYQKMGQIEIEDHAQAVKYISERSYIDASRVGIFGHSYGGYLTCIALLKKPDIFHVGVAGAPVTDWRNYDTIYTERYMRKPVDNPEGYKLGSCMNYAKNLKGKLFLHHGWTDNNVHPGNTVQLAYALLNAGKRFDLMIYPEQQHGIRFRQYGQERIDYFVKHLEPETKEEYFSQK